MKNMNTVFNGVILVAVIVLFVLVLKKDGIKPQLKAAASGTLAAGMADGKIAYFEMDSIEQHYNYIKDVREKIKDREMAISNELNDLKKGYMGRVQQLQANASKMSQQEGEAAQAEINQMQQSMQQKEGRLSQELQDLQFKLMQDINKRIEDYLKVFNSQNKFSFILSHSPGDHIYFKDSTLDLTPYLLKGLNDSYKKK